MYSRLLRDRVRQGPIHTPTAQNSHLGWILSGHVGPPSGNMSQRVAVHITVDRSSSSDLQRLWEQEEAPAGPAPLRSEDYEVRRSLEALDDSFPAAKHMLHRMERRFVRDAKFHKDYSAFMTEYENLGHMEVVPSTEESKDCDLQGILWREPSSDSTHAYCLRTVTYRLACAPFLAIRVIRQLASEQHLIGAAALLTDVYVDDVLSDADDASSALMKHQQLIELLKAGGFVLRKWMSNSLAALDQLPSQSVGGTFAIAWQPEAASELIRHIIW